MQARKKLCAVYGKDVLTERQCQNWFSKFRSGNFDLKDAPRKVLEGQLRLMKTKDIGGSKSSHNNTRNCCEIEFIEFDRS